MQGRSYRRSQAGPSQSKNDVRSSPKIGTVEVSKLRLKNKVCLVTDSAAMDGPAIAAEFLAEGAHLVLQAPDRGLAERELAKDDVDFDGIEWIEADFAERGVAEREIARLVAEVGTLDVLVNNNARRHRQAEGEPFVDTDDTEVASIMSKLVYELLYTTRAAVRHMVAAGHGRIVNLGSTGGVVGFAQFVPYCTARAAAIGLTLSLAKEVAPKGVYVNAIVQNYIANRTYFRDDQLADESYVARLSSAVPLGRLGKAREVAKLAAFLASDDSGFITGEIIRCAGGTALSA